ncbi:histone H2A-like [Brachionus plicatilis]|uniref:Histone H2A n=1 Tax=Brachionus plicatilis TaxID=10195 RepID=A0A3M7T5R9_BRAPC|nr:histone H2A-like [Brachionus plicatilis]
MSSPENENNLRGSSRAGLLFPVRRIDRLLKKGNYSDRIGSAAPVYLSAVLEYLTAEILELSGNAAKDIKKKESFLLTIRNDAESTQLLSGITISQCVILPKIRTILLPKKEATST